MMWDCTIYSIYGEVDEEILVDSFLNYICEDERETVQNVLAVDAKESIFESKDSLISWIGLSGDLKLQSSMQEIS